MDNADKEKKKTKRARLSLGNVSKKSSPKNSPMAGKVSPKRKAIAATKTAVAPGAGPDANTNNNTTVGCLEGMSGAELTMVRKLAGNDPIVRKKTLRKLKKWLNVLAQKVPDVQGKVKVVTEIITVTLNVKWGILMNV